MDSDPAITLPVGAPVAGADPGAPFVRVYQDEGTGNVIIALNAVAMEGLLTVLGAGDLKELAGSLESVGLAPKVAELASGVGLDILGQLKKLAPYVN